MVELENVLGNVFSVSNLFRITDYHYWDFSIAKPGFLEVQKVSQKLQKLKPFGVLKPVVTAKHVVCVSVNEELERFAAEHHLCLISLQLRKENESLPQQRRYLTRIIQKCSSYMKSTLKVGPIWFNAKNKLLYL